MSRPDIFQILSAGGVMKKWTGTTVRKGVFGEFKSGQCGQGTIREE